MYFTRFPLNMSRRETRAMLGNPYRMHAAIAASFPPDTRQEPGESGRVLWRVDDVPTGGFVLYIVSPTQPSLVGLDEQIGWPDLTSQQTPQWQTKLYDQFLARIQEGQQWAFRLVANPVLNRSKGRNNGERTSRIGHLTPLQQTAWLMGKEAYAGTDKPVPALFLNTESSRAQRNGFEIAYDPITQAPRIQVSNSTKQKFTAGKKGEITLTRAQYDGILRVTDAELLRRALINGIGHAKGFGCGLLTLAPVR